MIILHILQTWGSSAGVMSMESIRLIFETLLDWLSLKNLWKHLPSIIF